MMRVKKNKLGPLDKYLLSSIVLLLIFGLIMLFSASVVNSQTRFDTPYYFVKNQLTGLAIGLIVFYIALNIDYHIFKKYSLFFLFLSFLMLILVFVPGLQNEYGTAYSWIVIQGKTFQVSEAVKLFFLFYLAAWLESRQEDLKTIVNGILPFLLVLITIGAFILNQPDLGTFIIICFIAFTVYMVAGGSFKHLFILFLIAVIGIIFVFSSINSGDENSLVKGYQAERIRCLQDLESSDRACYQINQSLIAVGSGGLWGRGLGESRQKFSYLPEVWADSIFPIISEEIGFIGSTLLILAYLFIFVRGMIIASRAPDLFGQSLAVGISAWIFIQAFLNIGGMINLIPMTGVPLPFVSAGGSSLMILLFAVGIMLNISKQGNVNNKLNVKKNY